MRFLTDSGEFGFLISPTTSPRFFRFQLIVRGQIVGDRDPCILGTAMQSLPNLMVAKAPELLDRERSAEEVWELLVENDEVHDRTLLPLAESFDGLSIRGYFRGDEAVFLWATGPGSSSWGVDRHLN